MELEIMINDAATRDELILALANVAMNIAKGEYLEGKWQNIIGQNGEFMPDVNGYPIGLFKLTTEKAKG